MVQRRPVRHDLGGSIPFVVSSCGCGCGETLGERAEEFRQGHDAKRLRDLYDALDAGDASAGAELRARGWRFPSQTAEAINRRWRRRQAPPSGNTPLRAR
jgi:hypothetical protein